ncbi:MAG: GMC family oxidoreductase [Elainellaceae cyanobacterium]
MKVLDLRQLENNLQIETDLCIVGSGPAGLSIAKEFAGTNIQVWVLESGGKTEEPDTQALYNIENVGAPRTIDQSLMRTRIYGGTSHIWTGRCAPFSEIDFQHRPWVPYSGWPITRKELDPYLERAGINLGLGPHCYDERLWKLFKNTPPKPAVDTTHLKPEFWQFSKSIDNAGEPARFGRNFMPSGASNIHLLLHANVTHINTDEEGRRFESVEVSTLEKKTAQIKAKAVVLCCGGIENARLLLASNRLLPQGLGNQTDMVGRFLMDHLGCVVGIFDNRRANKVRSRYGHYWIDNEQGRHVYLHGLALSPTVQKHEQLLNCAASLEEYSAGNDPWLTIRQLRSALKDQKITPQTYREALAILARPQTLVQGAYRRYVKHRPPLVQAERVDLYCLVEQQPDPNSRVTLSTEKDALGMPISRIDWKVSEMERQSIRRLSHLICQEFRRIGLPQPQLAEWLDDKENWMSGIVDRAHHTGTTRMTLNPKEGVVDTNCQVHGVEGLFVAGSSVFPTSGHANPTLMLVALSIRLADWLKANPFAA